jgi:predicted enzyme related to lactoylglutathione lyase
MSNALLAVSIDCADAGRLAGYWSQVLGRPIDDGATPDFASIGMGGDEGAAPIWMFHRVPEANRPKETKNRVHVDLTAESLEKAVARAVEYGGTRIGDFDEGGFQWTTLTDPEGNEFDIVAV